MYFTVFALKTTSKLRIVMKDPQPIAQTEPASYGTYYLTY